MAEPGVRFGRIPGRLIAACLLGAAAASLPAASAAGPLKQARPAAARPAIKPAAIRPAPVPVVRVVPGPPAPKMVLAPPQAIAEELRKKAGGKIKRVYAARNFRPLWAGGGNIGTEAEALIGFLDSAQLDGLKSSSYKPDKLREAVAKARLGEVKEIVKAELKLSEALSKYASDLRRPNKRDLAAITYADPRLKPQKSQEEAALRAGTQATSFPHYIAGMQWMSPHYLRMRNMLAQSAVRYTPEDVLRRLRLNRERTRFLPGPWTVHVMVDAASGRLWYYERGRQQGTMKVVAGKVESPTPMLVGSLRYAILNPYWNVPTDLVRTLTGPKILAGRTLESMGMEAMSDWTDKAQRLDPARIDWNAVVAGTQEMRVRQLPGPFNSMGRVKFLFPNDLGIYLHDTPHQELMAMPARHYSNGCVRLEDAPALGRWLLGKPLASLSSMPEQVVALPVPVPVYITYLTATEGANGPGLLADVYGRDGMRLAAK